MKVARTVLGGGKVGNIRNCRLTYRNYGLLWMEYMKENAPDRYRNLIRFGRLKKKASEVNEEAYEMLESIEIKYLAKHKPVNSASTMEMWKLREQTRMVAEEKVLPTVVYHYY